MTEDMVSIIIPAYNAAQYIGDTINNLLAQSVDKEIIVVDDGSTDNTREIVESCANMNKNIKYYYQPNSGVSSARNLGIKKSSGDYIIFVDSDDFLADGILSRCVQQMKGDVDCVIFAFQCLDPHNRIVRTVKYLPTGLYDMNTFCQNFHHLVLTSIINCIGTKLYRAAIIKDRGLSFNDEI